MRHLLITLILLLAPLSACTKTTYIKTSPPSAQITLDDGRELGPSPIALREDVWAWTKHTLTFTKKGYEPTTLVLDAGPSVANIAICGVGACFMWLFFPVCVMGRYPTYERYVELKRRPDLDDFDDDDPPPRGASAPSSSSSAQISFEPLPR